MASQSTVPEARHRPRVTAEWLSVLEMLVLGPLAGILVLGVIPNMLDIEWACTTAFGSDRTAGEEYIATFAVFGTLGWFAVLVASVYAGIAEARSVAAILPVAWFVLLVGAALIFAVSISPATCPI